MAKQKCLNRNLAQVLKKEQKLWMIMSEVCVRACACYGSLSSNEIKSYTEVQKNCLDSLTTPLALRHSTRTLKVQFESHWIGRLLRSQLDSLWIWSRTLSWGYLEWLYLWLKTPRHPNTGAWKALKSHQASTLEKYKIWSCIKRPHPGPANFWGTPSSPLHGLGGEFLLYLLDRHAVGVHVVFTVIIILMVQQCSCPGAHVIRGKHSSKLRGQNLGMN